MPLPELGRLQPVDVRDVWANEARDFTPWLLANADRLAEALGIDLDLRAAEHPVGNFSLDLIGRDLTNDCELIVENQLGTTDHGHLGQLMTYAAGTRAQTIVWIAPEFREEHREALRWLNNIAGDQARFFGVEVSVVRIGDSTPAPLFRLRAEPNEWSAVVSRETHALSDRQISYRAFWEKLLGEIQARFPQWRRSSRISISHYINLVSPFPHAHYAVVFRSGGTRLLVELYMDTRRDETGDVVFSRLFDAREQIERVFGEPLVWEDRPGRPTSVIFIERDVDVSDATRHGEYVEWILDVQQRMRAALASPGIDFSDVE